MPVIEELQARLELTKQALVLCPPLLYHPHHPELVDDAERAIEKGLAACCLERA